MKNNYSLSHRSQEPESSTLYIVGTPIGNLNDISPRAINILKNASESILENEPDLTKADQSGLILVGVSANKKQVQIWVEDNGRGLPDTNREKLLEPYITTRIEGTGLGLAIVKKIVDDHNGELLLEDRSPKGSKITIKFNRKIV